MEKTEGFSKDDPFFKIGAKKEQKLLAVEETKDWKDIKPKQDYDAVNKQAWKKKKSDERNKLKELNNRPMKRFKGVFKQTEEQEVQERKRQLIKKIENLVGSDAYKIFIEGFRDYKTNPKATIDEYTSKLFEAFFGSKEPVCHLEVANYLIRKQELIKLEEEVHKRHLDRY